MLIRPRSALGLKYVEITKGNLPVNGSENAKRNGFADGATIPLRNATPSPVEIDEVFNTFDKPTRVASQTNLTEFGNALAGRGQGLNDAIQFAPVLLASLIPVAQNLSNPATRLNNLFPALERAAVDHRAGRRGPGRPLRQPRHDLLGAGRRGPAVHPGLDLQRPAGARPRPSACSRSSACSWPTPRSSCRDLRPGVKALSTAAPAISEAFTVGTPALLRSVALNARLTRTFKTIEAFSE